MNGFFENLKLALQPKKFYLPFQAKRYARKTETEIKVLPHIVPMGCAAIDGGANKGVYSWWLSQRCTQVHAFEPNPRMYRYLSRAVPRNVKTYQLALAREKGKRQFTLPTTNGTVHHTRGSLYDVKAGSDSLLFDVETIDIDSMTFENLGFIKLDLEGAELECLEGAGKTLERHRPVVMTEVTGVGGSSPSELFTFMLELNYEAFVLNDAVLEYHGRNAQSIPVERNCVFFPNLGT